MDKSVEEIKEILKKQEKRFSSIGFRDLLPLKLIRKKIKYFKFRIYSIFIFIFSLLLKINFCITYMGKSIHTQERDAGFKS